MLPLNFGNDTYQIAEDAARAAWEQVDHDSIWAFEREFSFASSSSIDGSLIVVSSAVGNESGDYKASQRNTTTWNADSYAKQWSVRRLPPLSCFALGCSLIPRFIHSRTGPVLSNELSISLTHFGPSSLPHPTRFVSQFRWDPIPQEVRFFC